MQVNHESDNLEVANIQVNRDHLQEDNERVPVFYREIVDTDFQEVTFEELDECEQILRKMISNVPFNSFYSLNTLMKAFRRSRDIKESFGNLIVDSINRPTQSGMNCVGLSYELQRRLRNKGIHSFIAPSHAGGLVNKQADEYADIAHALLVIPGILDGRKTFTVFDPWLILPRRMTFGIGEESQRMIYSNKSCRVISDNSDTTFPYRIMLGMEDGQGSYAEVHGIKFNPYLEVLNPDTSITIDVMRGAVGASYIKHDEEGNRVALVDFNFMKQRVRVKIAQGVGTI